MYKFKYREIHNTLTGELIVVHVRTFINLLTSEFGSSTRGERHTILKSLSYHTMLKKTNSNARHISWGFRSPFIFAGWDPKNLTVCRNGRNPNFSTLCLELTSTVRLHGPSRLPARPVPIRQLTGLVPNKLPTRLAHSRVLTDVFFKMSKFSAHCFQA